MWGEMGKKIIKQKQNPTIAPFFYGGLIVLEFIVLIKLKFIFILQVGMIPAIYWRNLLRFTTFLKKIKRSITFLFFHLLIGVRAVFFLWAKVSFLLVPFWDACAFLITFHFNYLGANRPKNAI